MAEPLSLYRIHSRQTSGAYCFVLKGTPFEFKKKLFDHRRLAKNLARIVSAPFKRPQIVRERRLRAYHNASNLLMVFDQLLAQRRSLGLPEISTEEQLYFQKMRDEWKVILNSQTNGKAPNRQ